ncbi:MAG TPA: peptidoglycan-associated lipoprotein, partial [Gallionellaceae bacterium]|nr:peptidoglycan-associated lipoprotein [Gallionellaceae bacterium]
MKNIALSILMVSLLAACTSQKPKEEAKQQAPAVETQQPAPVAATPKAAEPVAVDALDDPNSILAKR